MKVFLLRAYTCIFPEKQTEKAGSCGFFRITESFLNLTNDALVIRSCIGFSYFKSSHLLF